MVAQKSEVVVELEPSSGEGEVEVVELEGGLCFFNPFIPMVLQIVTRSEGESILYLFNYSCLRSVTMRKPAHSTTIDQEFDRQFVLGGKPVEEDINNAI